eukprot:TRINITY_DN842_c0_g2_i12.p1 TRINITY_DN842_c0_g2~~TRINITY_DN842_c0_g2_i12.p1  ORF type:complete len:288 (-),score=123.27 TRINITY_DN842_c0_g2_i12:428-1252(-)
MEIISSEIKNNKENTFQIVLTISKNNTPNKISERDCEEKGKFQKRNQFGRRGAKFTVVERIKFIEQKINFLNQKLNENQEKKEMKERLEFKISKLSQRKTFLQNKSSSNQPNSSEISSFNIKFEHQEQPQFKEMKCGSWRRERRNRGEFCTKENIEKVNDEEFRKRKIDCIEKRINRLGEYLLNEKISQEKQQKILSKIEFLSQRQSDFLQNKNQLNKIELNNERKLKRCGGGERNRCSKSISERIQFLEERKKKIEEKINLFGNTNQNLKERL